MINNLLILAMFFLFITDGRTPIDPLGNPFSLPDSPPTDEPEPTPEPAETPERVWGLGQLWVGITEWDTGHCPGYGMPSGSGSRPALAWPVNGTANDNRPFSVTHSGLDIYAPEGTPVWAAASGTVIWAGWSTWGFGETVILSHGGGWYTIYAHLSAVVVSCGAWIGAGGTVGAVGTTGASNYSHLHFELRNGSFSYSPFGG